MKTNYPVVNLCGCGRSQVPLKKHHEIPKSSVSWVYDHHFRSIIWVEDEGLTLYFNIFSELYGKSNGLCGRPLPTEPAAWGQPVQNLALSLRLANNDDHLPIARTDFDSANSIVVRLVATNLASATVWLDGRYGRFNSWRMTLFDSRGIPVQKTPEGLKQDFVVPAEKMPFISGPSFEVPHGEESLIFLGWLDTYFKIEHTGTYRLIMMRKIVGSWDDGILVSNLVEFQVKKATGADSQSYHPDGVLRPSGPSNE